MTPEAEVTEAANHLAVLIEGWAMINGFREAAIPKHQAARNKALRSATKKIIKLTRGRPRATKSRAGFARAGESPCHP